VRPDATDEECLEVLRQALSRVAPESNHGSTRRLAKAGEGFGRRKAAALDRARSSAPPQLLVFDERPRRLIFDGGRNQRTIRDVAREPRRDHDIDRPTGSLTHPARGLHVTYWNGAIVESGCHEDLLASKGLMARCGGNRWGGREKLLTLRDRRNGEILVEVFLQTP